MSLDEKRLKIIAEHRAMEKYHPSIKADADAGRRISEHPIAFLCDDEVVIVGDCIGRVLDGLKAFFEQIGADRAALESRLANEPAFAQAVAKSRAVLEAAPAAELRVPQNVWNALNYALSEAGRPVVLTDGREAVPVSLLEFLRGGK